VPEKVKWLEGRYDAGLFRVEAQMPLSEHRLCLMQCPARVALAPAKDHEIIAVTDKPVILAGHRNVERVHVDV